MGILLFNSAFGFYVLGLLHSVAAFVSKKTNLFHKIALVSVSVGFVLHSAFLIYSAMEKARLPLTDLKEALTFFAWTVSLCFFISHLRYRIKPLALFLLPLVTVLMLGTIFIKSSPIPEIFSSSWIYWHTICLFLAYGMFFVTFIASLLYLFQERELKGKKPKTFYYWLPSLVLLDDLFYKFLISGFCFMTLGLLAGVIWAEQGLGRGMAKRPQSHRGTRHLGNLSGTDLSAFNGGMAREARSPDQHGRLSFRPFHLFGGTLPGRIAFLSMMDLVLVGLNHKTAPVEVRERIAFAEKHLQPALKRLQKDSDLLEGMIVSTCNRVEILAHGQKSQAQIVQSVKDFLYSYHTLKPPLPRGLSLQLSAT